MQLTLPLGTAPFDVGELNEQVSVRTTVPGGCSIVIVALVKARSVIASVHRGFGQSGAPAIVADGAVVVTSKVTVPFLTSLAGMD